MATSMTDLMQRAYSKVENSLYSGSILSVGGGGTNISINSTEAESRGVANASPYGFVSSPPTNCYGFVAKGQEDGLIGIIDPNRPSGVVTGGGTALYSIGNAYIILNSDGSIDINTPTGKTAKYNGHELGTAESGVTEEWVEEYVDNYDISTKVNSTTLVDGSVLDTQIDDLISANNTRIRADILGECSRLYVSLTTYTTKMALLDQLIGDLDVETSGIRTDLDNEIYYSHHYCISEASLVQKLYGTDEPVEEVYRGSYVPTLENEPACEWESYEYEDHEGEIFLITGIGEEAGYYYIFELDTTTGLYHWRKATQAEMARGYITGVDQSIREELHTNYWTGAYTSAEIRQASDAIRLVVDVLSQNVTSQFSTVYNSIGNIQTTLIFYQEATSRLQSEVAVLEGEVALKANQSTVNTISDILGNVETTVSEHSATLSVIPQQIQSTVTTAVSAVKVGSKNLIHNSMDIDFTNYYFDDTLGSSIIGDGIIGDMIIGG